MTYFNICKTHNSNVRINNGDFTGEGKRERGRKKERLIIDVIK